MTKIYEILKLFSQKKKMERKYIFQCPRNEQHKNLIRHGAKRDEEEA